MDVRFPEPPNSEGMSALREYRVTRLEENMRTLEARLASMESHLEQKLDDLGDSFNDYRLAATSKNSTFIQNLIIGPAISAVLSGAILWVLLRVVSHP